MKIAVRIVQIFVGVLFILSGLVKANDPVGLDYKMQEFFEKWTADLSNGGSISHWLINLLHFFNEHSLFLSVTMITLEIVAGVALLIGGRKKFVLWLLFLLIVFFTFLTAYAYLSKNPGGTPKFTNCGCFGDCLPLTPKTSFLKDIVLLVLILFLLAGQRFIQPLFSRSTRALILLLSLFVTILFQWYVLNYLPLVDCLPFKKGNSLPEQTHPPKNAIPSVYETRLIYQNKKTGAIKDMSQDEFNASKIWEDTSWKWKESPTRLVKKGNDIPAIENFYLKSQKQYDSVSGNMVEMDSTQIVLSQPTAILGFGLDSANGKWVADFKNLIVFANQKKMPVYFSTNNPTAFEQVFKQSGISVQIFSTDFTVVRTAARVNPTFYLLKSGTIINKFGYRNMDDLMAQLKKQ